MSILWPTFFLFLFLFLFSTTTLATLVNVTIDDNGTEVVYFPPGAWNFGPTCSNCTPRPDSQQAYLGTWHYGTFAGRSNDRPNALPAASVQFYGSAVYVYCILVDTQGYLSGYSDMTFLVDSQLAGTFTHLPSGDHSLQYNVLVFADESLRLGYHNLTIQNGHVNGLESMVLLDYIVYSHDDTDASKDATPDSSNSPRIVMFDTDQPSINQRGKIIGGTLGTVSLLLLVLVASLFYRQHKSISRNPPASNNKPPVLDTAATLRRWFRWPLTKSKTTSHFSFNPSLFVGQAVNCDHTQFSPSPGLSRPKRPQTPLQDASYQHFSPPMTPAPASDGISPISTLGSTFRRWFRWLPAMNKTTWHFSFRPSSLTRPATDRDLIRFTLSSPTVSHRKDVPTPPPEVFHRSTSHYLSAPNDIYATPFPRLFSRHWFRRPRPKSESASYLSFHPSLFVAPVADHENARLSPPPPTVPSPRRVHTISLHLDSPLQTNVPVIVPADSRLERSQPLSIIEWRRRTQEEAETMPPPFDIPEVELSSYYADSTDSYPVALPHPSKPVQRRFTVVNN